MFELLVEDASVVFGHATVTGKCKNRKDFAPRLIDDNGAVYNASIPFIKHVAPPDADYITLELMGAQDLRNLVGLTLRVIPK